MPSERAQRHIDRLLDEADQAIASRDWALVRTIAQDVLALDPENAEARDFLAAAERRLRDLSPDSSSSGGPERLARGEETVRSGVGARFIAPAAESGTLAGETPALPGIPTPDTPPTSFANGRYVVKKFLGEGGKKRVYLAHDTLLDRDVAFALIKTEGLDATGRDRTKREAQAMGRLGAHPHIVSVYDLGEEPGEAVGSRQSAVGTPSPSQSSPGQPYIVTELMGGGDVEGIIERAPEHRPPLEQTLRIGIEVCRGLEFAHGHGIVHRDLKPGNVWLTAEGVAKLGDFGLAIALDRSRLTQAGMMVGTVSYMPPEQAMGGEVTPRADLYSLGAMLYEMACGPPPFIGDESVAIITQHLNMAPVAPSWHNPQMPPALEALILYLLEKDPAKRPASTSEVRAALEAIHPSSRRFPAGEAPRGKEETSSPPLAGEGLGERSFDNPLYRRTFVGREQELRQLQAVYDAALSGQGALVMVVGEPGIGKTSLCEQLATYAAIRGGRTLVGHCYEEGSLSLPYLPFVEVMRSYVLAREPEGLRQDLGSGAGDVARIVSEIRDRLPDSVGARFIAPAPAGDPEEERYRLFQAVTGFLRNAATMQPLLIVLEDLHDADRGTLDLLVHLSRGLAGARLVLVGTYRDIEVDRGHPLSGTLAELRRAASFSRVLLRGLTADEVQRMLSQLSGQQISWGLAEAVHRQTEGNPLFIQEVLRYLVEEGLVRREDPPEAGWRRASDQAPLEMGIPEGLRDVIGKRLSRLSLECNRLLSIAAVIGRDFGLTTLQQVAGRPRDDLVERLAEAVRTAVLTERERTGEVHYHFAHAFFRQTLYEELGAARRIQFHQQVARALEEQYGARLSEHAAELAEHFAHSSERADLAKAVRYAEAAAERALSVYAYGEAVRHLEQALDVQEVLDPDDKAKRCDLLLALGEALGAAGDPERGHQSAASLALELAEQLADAERASQACVMALRCLTRYSPVNDPNLPETAHWAERASRYARPGTIARVYADEGLGTIRYIAGQYAEAHELWLGALELARSLANREAMVRAVRPLLARRFGPRYELERLRLAEEFAGVPREGISGRDLGGCLFHAGLTLMEWGEHERAANLWGELPGLAARTGDPNAVFYELTARMMTAWRAGRLVQAAGDAAQLRSRAEELGVAGFGREYARRYGSRPPLALGRYELVFAFLQETGRYEFDSALRALAMAHAGRLEEAGAILDRFVGRPGSEASAADMPSTLLLRLLETAVLIRRRDAAQILSVRLADSGSLPGCLDLTTISRHLGAASVLLGEAEKARAHYEQALEVCAKVRFRPEAALTHLQLAELLLGSEADAMNRAPTPGGEVGISLTPQTPLPSQGRGRERGREGRGEGEPRASADARAEALTHLDFAIAEFREMKMQPALERALRHKELLKA